MSLLDNRKFVYAATLSVILAVLLAMYMNQDPRFIDGELTGEEILWWESIIVVCGVISVFLTVLSSARHAFRHHRPKWSVFVLLIWPLAFIYAWRFGLNEKAR